MKYFYFLIVLSVVFFSCRDDHSEEKKTSENAIAKNDSIVYPVMIRANEDSFPVVTPGENGYLPPTIINVTKPKIIPNLGVHPIKVGESNLPLTKDEYDEGVKPVKSIPPRISDEFGNDVILDENGNVISRSGNKNEKPLVITPGENNVKLPKCYFLKYKNGNGQSANRGIKRPEAEILNNDSLEPIEEIPLLCKPSIIQALSPRYKENAVVNIKNYDIEQGLSSSVIKSIKTDHNGFLWIATNGGGVSKYDGKTFTNYTMDQGLCNNYINAILEDKNGNMWFGSYGGGISKFDGEKFTTISTKHGLSNNNIFMMFEDKDGIIWIGSNGGGLDRYDGETIINFSVEQGLTTNGVMTAYQDNNGDVWFCNNLGGISKYNGKSFTQIKTQLGTSNISIFAILNDSKGNIWLGTSGSGAIKYDGRYFTHYTPENGLKGWVIYSLLEDRKGNIWFGAIDGGASKFDGKTFVNYNVNNGLGSNYVKTLTEDNSGHIWIGTEGGGISKYEGETFTHFTTRQGISDNIVHAIAKDKNGCMWFATNEGGLTKFITQDEENNPGEYFVHYKKENGLFMNSINHIYFDKKGALWIGFNYGGLAKFEFPKNKSEGHGKLMHYLHKQGINCEAIVCISEDSKGNMWIGTDGGGINRFDGKSFTYITSDYGLCYNVVLVIYEDKRGNFWIGTYGSGLSVYDGKCFMNMSIDQGLSGEKVYTFYEDKEGNFWIATSNKLTILTKKYLDGLMKYKEEFIASGKNKVQNKGKFRFDSSDIIYLSKNEGLSGNLVKSLMEDRQGNIWLSTDKGPTKLIPTKNRKTGTIKIGKQLYDIRTYTISEGFLGGGLTNNFAMAEDNNGNIWFGTRKLLTRYNPNCDIADTLQPMMYLKNIKLFFEETDWKNADDGKNEGIRYNSLIQQNTIPVELSLPYNLNHITFDFVGIWFPSPLKIKYQYTLEGQDNSWSPLTSSSEATFSNLDPGKYTFKVKALSGEGVWSKTLSYSFEIRPPWWDTWWFRTIYIFLGVMLLIGIYLWRTAALRRREKILVGKVKEATAEISEKNEELKLLVEEVSTQKDEIEAQRDLVTEQKNRIESIHREVEQSIDYAKKLQAAILPESQILKENVEDFFVLFMPKDKVSGDFYWWAHVEGHTVITAADCTGHGVPGAFMSMLGVSFLREIVLKEYITHPGVILRKLRKEIIRSLKQKGMLGEQKDGMDMALVSIDHAEQKIMFAGANNPLFLIRNNNLNEYKADKMPIAIYDKMDNYSVQEIPIEKGDIIYLFSDGFADQFGGDKGKKLMNKKFKEILVSNNHLTMEEQRKALESHYKVWKGHREQVDDVVVIGIKI